MRWVLIFSVHIKTLELGSVPIVFFQPCVDLTRGVLTWPECRRALRVRRLNANCVDLTRPPVPFYLSVRPFIYPSFHLRIHSCSKYSHIAISMSIYPCLSLYLAAPIYFCLFVPFSLYLYLCLFTARPLSTADFLSTSFHIRVYLFDLCLCSSIATSMRTA